MAAAVAAARSVIRSPSVRSTMARISSVAAARPSARSPLLRNLGPRPAAARFLRNPVEGSFCMESLMPMHSATASALMTSMLSVSRRGFGWLSEAGKDDV